MRLIKLSSSRSIPLRDNPFPSKAGSRVASSALPSDQPSQGGLPPSTSPYPISNMDCCDPWVESKQSPGLVPWTYSTRRSTVRPVLLSDRVLICCECRWRPTLTSCFLLGHSQNNIPRNVTMKATRSHPRMSPKFLRVRSSLCSRPFVFDRLPRSSSWSVHSNSETKLPASGSSRAWISSWPLQNARSGRSIFFWHCCISTGFDQYLLCHAFCQAVLPSFGISCLL